MAVCKPCRSDLRAPVEGLRNLVVLGGIPERATVLVDAHGAVIAPAVGGVGLRTGTAYHFDLVPELAQGIGGHAAGHEDRWVHRRAAHNCS